MSKIVVVQNQIPITQVESRLKAVLPFPPLPITYYPGVLVDTFMSNRQNLRSACDTLGDLVSDFQPSNYSNLQISVFHQAYAALHGAEYNATMGIYEVAKLSQITQQLDYLILMLERQFQGQAVIQHQVRVNNHFEAIGEALDRSPTPVDTNLCDVSEELRSVTMV